MELVPPTRIERATRGLGIVAATNSADLTPQGTTNHDTADMGLDGVGLPCPGSSEVADVSDEKLQREVDWAGEG